MLKYFKTLLFGLVAVIASAQPQNTNPQVIDEVVAVIGGEIILASDIGAQLSQLKQSYNMVTSDSCMVIEDMLLEKLMLHHAKIDSVEVSDQQVENELDRRIRYFIGQIGSEKKLEEYYKKSIVEIKEEFRGVLKDQLRIQAMQGEIQGQIKITPAEVKVYFDAIPLDSLPLIDSQVEFAQIVIYPEENREEIKRVKDKLNEFLQEVKEGKDFSTLAVLYSEDPGSATQGGELGMSDKGTFVPEFDAVALGLRDGETSKPFKTQYGFHIMQMIERRGESYNARHILLKPRMKPADLALAKAKVDSIIQLVQKGTYTFEAAAEEFSMDELSKNSGGVVVSDKGSPRFDMKELDPQTFVSIDKLEKNDISEPVLITEQTGKQGYRAIKLLERTEPHRASIRDDYQLIQDAASQENRSKVLKNWVETKVAITYVKLDKHLQQCETQFNWIKE